MDVVDGFIVSVFNYCDQWCEACPLTSHCRLFADLARADAAHDCHMAPIFAAASRPPQPPPVSTWLFRLIGVTPPDRPLGDGHLLMGTPLPSEHKTLCERALAYAIWVREWLDENQRSEAAAGSADPLAIISWFAPLNASKIHRALTGLAEFDGDRGFPPDHEGSAKVALIGLDRSVEAWRQLVTEHRVAESVARPCLDELCWMTSQLETAIPNARAFVRPGLDEPEEVRKLVALERS
jgi:hypothetical protein